MEKYADDNFSVAYLKKSVPVIEKILPENLMNGLKDMKSSNKQADENTVLDKENTNGTKKENEGAQNVPYEKKDLDSMDNLLESIKE